MYARVHFPESKKEAIDDIVRRIRKEFRVMLEEVDWIFKKIIGGLILF